MSPEAKSLLKGLLQRPVDDRLGSGPTDAEELKAHPFFKDIDWDLIEQKKIKPEFQPPNRLGSMDVTNFDREFTSEKAIDSVVTSNLTETQQQKSEFLDFTYNADTMSQNQK